MSVAVADVRFAIQDQPRSFGVQPESPRVLGTGDGSTMTFYLPLGQWLQLVAGSLQLYATANGATTGIASSAYTITQQGLITFTTPPAAAVLITASFQATGFADADLANVLARNLAQYGVGANSDANTLRGCQIEIINTLLANPDRMAAMKEAEWARDRNAVIAAYRTLLAELRTQIATPPRPDRSTPFLTAAGPTVRPYQPGR